MAEIQDIPQVDNQEPPPQTPQQPPDKVRALYDAVSHDYDLGDFDTFKAKLQDPQKQQAFYNSVGKDYDLGSFDEFKAKVSGGGQPAQQPTTSELWNIGTATADHQKAIADASAELPKVTNSQSYRKAAEKINATNLKNQLSDLQAKFRDGTITQDEYNQKESELQSANFNAKNDVDKMVGASAGNEPLMRRLLVKTSELQEDKNPQKARDIKKQVYLIDSKDRGQNAQQILDNANKIEKGELDYDINGKRVVKPIKNPFVNAYNAISGRNKDMDLFNYFSQASPAEAAITLRGMQKTFNPDEPVNKASGILGNIGNMVGENIVPIVGGAAGGTAATLVGGPEAAPAGAAIANSVEMARRGWINSFMNNANQLINQGTDPEEAVTAAKSKANVDASIDAATGALMGYLGTKAGITPKYSPFKLSDGYKSVLQTIAKNVGKFGVETTPEGGVNALLAAGGQGLKNINNGVNPQEGTTEAAMGMLLLHYSLAGVGALRKTGLTKEAYEQNLNGLAKLPTDKVNEAIQREVLSGNLTPDQANEKMSIIQTQRDLNNGLPDTEIPQENKEKIQKLKEKRDELEWQIHKDNPNMVDKAFHKGIKDQIEGVKKTNTDGTTEGKDGVNEQIRQLTNAEKPKGEVKVFADPMDRANEIIKEKAVDGKIGNYDVSDPDELMKNIAEQAHGGMMVGDKFVSSRSGAEDTFGHELVDIATKMHPEHRIFEPKAEAEADKGIILNKSLRTLDYGDWKGKLESKESQDKIKDEILNNQPIGNSGERIEDFANRVIPGANKIIENPLNNTTIVTHSSVIKAIKVWDEMGRPDKIDESNLKEFTDRYVNAKPAQEGNVYTIKGKNGTDTHIIRHGETEDNKLSEFRQDDTELTDKGQRQAALAGKELYDITKGDVPSIDASDLPRTVHTSNIIEGELNPSQNKTQDNAIQQQAADEMGVRNEAALRSGVGGQDTESKEPTDESIGSGSGRQPPTEEKGQAEEEENGLTSIRNAVTEEKIKAAGLKQPITEGVRTFGNVWDEAKAKVDVGYDTNHLVDELEKNPSRPLTDLEDALLTYHNAVKEAELFDINKKINEAAESGNISEAEQYQSDKAKVMDDLQRIYNIDKQAGAANARGLNARKLMVDRKYSLAAMVAEKRASENFGEPLDKEQQAEVEKQFEDIKKAHDALQEYTKKLEAENAKLKAEKGFEKAKGEKSAKKTNKTKEDYAAERKKILDDYKAKKASDTTKRQGIGISDEDVKMVAKIFKSYVEEGVENLKEAVSKIHDAVKDYVEGISEKDIHNIIAGEYNKPKPTRSEISRQISDLKAEASLVNKIEELQKGPKPKNSKEKVIQNKKLYDLRQQIKELKDTPAAKTEAAKERIQKQIFDLNQKIKNGDFSPPVKKTPPVLDKEGFRLKAEYEKAKDIFDQGIKRNEIKNSTPYKRFLRLFVRGERAFKLSNPITIGKLASAAATRMATAPIEEGVGAAWSKILPNSITSKATGEAGFHAKALAKGYTQAMMQGIKEAGETAKGIKTSLEANFGKKGQLPPEALDFFGQLHSALKAPVKRFAFERSYEKRMANNIKNGVNVDDPMVQARISVEAYQDANRAIFMQDNWVSKGWNTAIRSLENSNNKGANIGAAVAQWLLPFVKVPTNIVAETAQHTFGLATGLGKIISVAANEGLKNISQEDAESIMRNLKKGSVGAAAMTLGFLNPQAFGGYYQDKEKRNPKDVRYGETRVFGIDIPAWVQEAPIFQAMQFGSTIRRLADGYMGKKPMGMLDGTLSASFGLLAHEPLWDEPARLFQLKDPSERKWVVGELAKSTIVPSLIDYTAKATDPADKRPLWERFVDPVIQRKPTGKDWPSSIKEHIQSGIPIINQQLDLKKAVKGAGGRF